MIQFKLDGWTDGAPAIAAPTDRSLEICLREVRPNVDGASQAAVALLILHEVADDDVSLRCSLTSFARSMAQASLLNLPRPVEQRMRILLKEGSDSSRISCRVANKRPDTQVDKQPVDATT